MVQAHYDKLILALILLLGALARLAPLGLQRFHEDEALYSSWGLRIAGGDTLLTEVPVDKPPLSFYLQAGGLALLGVSETSARLPSLVASVTSIWLLYLLAQRLYGQPTALVASALLAASPFAISFAPTAFLDAVMGMWVLAACVATAFGHWSWSGALLGLAGTTKWEGVIFLPLVGALGICTHSKHISSVPRKLLRAVASLLAIAALVGLWDLARPQPSILGQLQRNYRGLALAQPEILGERFFGWKSLMRYVFYHPWLNVIFLAGLPLLLLIDVRDLARAPTRDKASLLVDPLLVTSLAFFLATLILLRLPIWDRYLLGLVPFGCLLLARVLWLPRRFLPRSSKAHLALSILVIALLLFTLPLPMRDAASGRFSIAGDHGTYQGIKQVVAYFRGQVMGGAILYHRWLGYHYRFYMYRFPYAFRWWRMPEELAQDAAAASDVERWIVFPSWQEEGPARRALAARGLRLITRHQVYRDDGSLSFTIYQIEEP